MHRAIRNGDMYDLDKENDMKEKPGKTSDVDDDDADKDDEVGGIGNGEMGCCCCCCCDDGGRCKCVRSGLREE